MEIIVGLSESVQITPSQNLICTESWTAEVASGDSGAIRQASPGDLVEWHAGRNGHEQQRFIQVLDDMYRAALAGQSVVPIEHRREVLSPAQ